MRCDFFLFIGYDDIDLPYFENQRNLLLDVPRTQRPEKSGSLPEREKIGRGL